MASFNYNHMIKDALTCIASLTGSPSIIEVNVETQNKVCVEASC